MIVKNPVVYGFIPKDQLDGGFTYTGAIPQVEISGFSPNSGSNREETDVLIKGKYFAPGVEVYFGDIICDEIEVIDASNIKVLGGIEAVRVPEELNR